MTEPRFSIISAVYNVGRYLDDFIASIEEQTFPLDQVEVIAVDDGSTDDSLDRLEAWARRRPGLVRVLSQPNARQAAARNAGLPHATGEWVTFIDPDDFIEPNYLAAVEDFLQRHPETDVVACRREELWESLGARRDHPLDHFFHAGDRLVDLESSPIFHGHAPSAFLPRTRLLESGIRFDTRLPNFEDGHFMARYLLALPAPGVGFVASAVYVYRKRDDNSSTSDVSRGAEGRYTNVPRYGHLDLLQHGAARPGGPPAWVQNLVLYDLMWNFGIEEKVSGSMSAARGPVAEEFNQLLTEILALVDPQVIAAFNAMPTRPVWRELLAHGYATTPWRPDHVVRDRRDQRARLDRIRYRFTGPPPVEQFTVDGASVSPVHAKTRDLTYFDQTRIRERLVWLPRGRLTVSLDGVDVNVAKTDPQPPPVDPRPGAAAAAARPTLTTREKWEGVVARSWPVRRLFASAWVLIDRVHDADDSAEHLFHFLRTERPAVNAWFVIERGVPDHRRLRAGEHRRRVVPYGSMRWRLLMRNAEHVISSHADAAITNPPLMGAKLARWPTWRFTFLQHGVIKDDISNWLNSKNIDVFVTSTPGEYSSICGDGTGYVYTTKETVLTGMPRLDRVREAGRRVPAERRDLILIAPTWRTWLVPSAEEGTQRRAGVLSDFADSDFAQQWRAVLGAPELRDLAARTGLTVATLLHPNLQAAVADLRLPPHVQTFGFEGQDVRQLFARCRVLVTDYSSMAFNAAYIDRPVVYFHFDHEEMFGGAHVGRGGYFRYERDGFGPVTFKAEEALAAIEEIVNCGPDPAERYRQRIAAAFPQRDGRCCERVYDAIVASVQPVGKPARSSKTQPRLRRLRRLKQGIRRG